MRHATLALLLVLAASPAPAQEAEPAPVPLAKVPADGEAHLVECKVGTYWIALPEGIDPKKETRVIFWCHGSNMNGKAYVGALQRFGYGKDEILIGPNGHHRVRDWVYNFNAPGYDTKLAYGILDDVEKRYRLGKIYVGGHSQGAYYTYRIVLSKPDRFAGAVPFAGGLLLGLDPKSAASRKGRPGPPFAIVHGESDAVVDPSLSDWAYEAFVTAEYPAVRYYHEKNHGHMWPGRAKEALEWVMALTADDPAALIASAEGFLEDDRGADALFCLERARDRKGDADRIEELEKKVIEKGAEHTAAWIGRMKEEKDGGWAAEMYGFRERWGTVPTVAPAMKLLEKLRKKHVPQARKLNRKAWKASRDGKKDEARKLFTKTAEECFTAFEYARAAKRWLEKN